MVEDDDADRDGRRRGRLEEGLSGSGAAAAATAVVVFLSVVATVHAPVSCSLLPLSAAWVVSRRFRADGRRRLRTEPNPNEASDITDTTTVKR